MSSGLECVTCVKSKKVLAWNSIEKEGHVSDDLHHMGVRKSTWLKREERTYCWRTSHIRGEDEGDLLSYASSSLKFWLNSPSPSEILFLSVCTSGDRSELCCHYSVKIVRALLLLFVKFFSLTDCVLVFLNNINLVW